MKFLISNSETQEANFKIQELPCIISGLPDWHGWRLRFGSLWLAFDELGGVPGVRPAYGFIPPAERAESTDWVRDQPLMENSMLLHRLFSATTHPGHLLVLLLLGRDFQQFCFSHAFTDGNCFWWFVFIPVFNHKLCAGISYALCNIPFKVILSELHDRKWWTEDTRTDHIIHFFINVATKTCVCMSWTGSVLHAVQWDAYHSSNDINHKTIQKETCQWAQVINHGRGTVALRGMKMISLLDEWLTWLWAQGVEQRGEVLLITMKRQTGAYLMELRKIFVRKLLATCTSFSEGIFWVTISIFIFLGSRGEEHTH